MKRRARLRVGDEAPDFELPDAEGRPWHLGDHRGRTSLVLFFYPGDFTPVCTREACLFRDWGPEFSRSGAQIIGISHDRPKLHEQFAAAYALPFRLLSDPDGRVRQRYGVRRAFDLWDRRATFVIDLEGRIRHAFVSPWRAHAHVEKALEAVRRLPDARTRASPPVAPTSPKPHMDEETR